MDYREVMLLGSDGYVLSYRNETRDRHWRMVHAHQGIEMLYIYQGKGEISLEKERYPLQAGTLVLFQPYQLHQVEVPVRDEASYVRTNLTFNPHIVEPMLRPFPRLAFFYRHLWKGVLRQQVFQLPEDSTLPALLADFHLAHQLPAAALEEERCLFFLALLRHLSLHVFALDNRSRTEEGRATQHVERIMDWVEDNFTVPFQLNRMADELHLSPWHLSHLFRDYTGGTLTDYIAARRVREACDLLITTDLPIKAISHRVGGLSDSYFCQLFKKWKGITPQAYRETEHRV